MLTRNYFGTFMTLGVALPLLYPYAWDFVQSAHKLYRDSVKFDGYEILHWLLTSEVLAAACFAVLCVSLVWKGLFAKSAQETRELFFKPLLVISICKAFALLQLFAIARLHPLKDLQEAYRIQHEVQMLFFTPFVCFTILNSMLANSPFTTSLLFQSFKAPLFEKRVKMNPVGCFMTVVTLIMPAVYTIRFIISNFVFFSIDPRSLQVNDFKVNAEHVTFFCTVFSAAMSLETLSKMGTDPKNATTDQPYLRGLSFISTPMSFLYVLKRLKSTIIASSMYRPWDERNFPNLVNICNNLSRIYLVVLALGIAGYIGYIVAPGSALAKIYRPFVHCGDPDGDDDDDDDDDDENEMKKEAIAKKKLEIDLKKF